MAQSQRKPKPAKAGSNLKPFYWALGAIGLVGVAGLAWSTMSSAQAAQEPVVLSPELLANTRELVNTAKGVKAGPDNAPVRILVFSDYMCPACKQFATAVEPKLRAEYINTGKVQLVYHDFPLFPGHQWSFVAARAGRCAEDQGKFWEYHDLLFTKQDDWRFSQSSPIGKLQEYATESGLDKGAFDECLKSDKHAQLVTANKTLGEQLRVGGTPTLFMNNRQLDREWSDFELLKARIDQELAPRPMTTTQ